MDWGITNVQDGNLGIISTLEPGKTFKQAMKKPVATWLPRLWDMGVNRISMPAAEARKVNPFLRKKRLHSLRQYEGSQSLRDIRDTRLLPSEVPINIRGWKARRCRCY